MKPLTEDNFSLTSFRLISKISTFNTVALIDKCCHFWQIFEKERLKHIKFALIDTFFFLNKSYQLGLYYQNVRQFLMFFNLQF